MAVLSQNPCWERQSPLTVQPDVVVGEDGRTVPPDSAAHGDTHGAVHSLHILLLGENSKDLSGVVQVLQSCCSTA